MNFSSSDLSKAIRRGFTPGHPSFAREVLEISRERRISTHFERIRSQTKGRGFTLTKTWHSLRDFHAQAEFAAFARFWQGGRAEQWSRGTEVRIVFFPSNDCSPPALFALSGKSLQRIE